MNRQEIEQKLLQTGMFLENKYFNAYIDLIIQNATTAVQEGKTQKHHILQRKWFDYQNLKIDSTKANLVNLLFKDHILAHYYLCKCTTAWLAKANTVTLINMTSMRKSKSAVESIIDELDEFQAEYERLWKSCWINQMPKDELFNFYIKENHTKEETAQHFDCCIACIDRWLARYGLMKTQTQHREPIDPELLYDLYINKNYTLAALGKFFNASTGKIKYVLRENNIKKGLNLDRTARRRISLSKEEFYDMYITQNMSIADMAAMLNVSRGCIKHYIILYDAHKTDRWLISEAIKKGKTK